MMALRALAVCATLLVGCSRSHVEHPVNGQRPLHLRVLATHDLHGALAPLTYAWSNQRSVGGMAVMKAWMDSAKSQCRCPTVRLDAGDQMQGTLESNLAYGAAAVRGFNLLGLDAAAVGNHELDWGIDTLLVRQAEARRSPTLWRQLAEAVPTSRSSLRTRVGDVTRMGARARWSTSRRNSIRPVSI